MSRIANIFNAKTWCAAAAVCALIAGCGSGGQSGDLGAAGSDVGTLTAPGVGGGVGGAGRGPSPINLRTATDFVILARTAITASPGSSVSGNVGLNPTTGARIGLTCLEVSGVIYTVDSAGPLPCRVIDARRLRAAESDAINGFENDGRLRVADYSDLSAGNIGGRNFGPATYAWSTGVQIASNLTLTGGPNDVWIFLITQDLRVGPDVSIVLAGGALPQNIFWLTLISDMEFGANSQFKGIVMAETSIIMHSGASLDGRLMAATSIALDQNRVTQPVP